jgi:hypothetical protein
VHSSNVRCRDAETHAKGERVQRRVIIPASDRVRRQKQVCWCCAALLDKYDHVQSPSCAWARKGGHWVSPSLYTGFRAFTATLAQLCHFVLHAHASTLQQRHVSRRSRPLLLVSLSAAVNHGSLGVCSLQDIPVGLSPAHSEQQTSCFTNRHAPSSMHRWAPSRPVLATYMRAAHFAIPD